MKFFIDDMKRIAEYAAANYPAAAAKVVKTADQVVEQKFIFNLRWDMERTSKIVAFDGEIDWLHQPADDAEWVYAFNRMHFWICLGQAYALTGKEIYAETFASQLQSWVKSVKQDDPASQPAWRSIEVGIRMEYWCKAFDYFKDSPSITDDVRTVFYESVAEHARFIMGVWNTYNLMSNWGVLANHGLYIASIAHPQNEETLKWREESLRRLALEMEMQIYEDGTQWEQSPMYHNEVTHCYLDILILARRNGIALPEGFEKRIQDMCRVNLWWTKPDGHQIAMGDSDVIDTRDITSKGAYLFQDGVLKSGAYEHLDFETVWELGYDAPAPYDALNTEALDTRVQALKDSGNYFYRSDWSPEASFLHFHCGTLGAGHGHSDQTHFDLFSRGEDILLDPGRYTYVDKPERYEFKDSTAHNCCLVDGKNFYDCTDSWECSKLSKAVNRSWNERGGYAFFEGGHLGYYDLPEGGVFANRKIIVLTPDLYVIADEFYAGTAHSYESRLHFNNSGELTPSGTGGNDLLYSSPKNKVYLSQLSRTGSPRTRLEPYRISRRYNETEDALASVCSFEGEGFASLFTVISLEKKAEVKMVPVRSNFKDIQFEDSLIEALTIRRDDCSYTVAVAHQEFASPTDTFHADGCDGFGQVVVFDRVKGETQIGTVLQW